MRKGSIVVKTAKAVNNPKAIRGGVIEPCPDRIYIVSYALITHHSTYIRLKGVQNPINPETGQEWYYDSICFDEVGMSQLADLQLSFNCAG